MSSGGSFSRMSPSSGASLRSKYVFEPASYSATCARKGEKWVRGGEEGRRGENEGQTGRLSVYGGESASLRERERDRQADIQTDRQTGRQADGENRNRGKQTDLNRGRGREKGRVERERAGGRRTRDTQKNEYLLESSIKTDTQKGHRSE